METILNEILANETYLIITAILIIAVILSIVKKITKLLIYSFIALAAFFVYIYYTGDTVAETIEQGQEAVEKAENAAEEKKKEIDDAKKKVEQELKK